MNAEDVIGTVIGAAFGALMILLAVRTINSRDGAVIARVIVSGGLAFLAAAIAGAAIIVFDAIKSLGQQNKASGAFLTPLHGSSDRFDADLTRPYGLLSK